MEDELKKLGVSAEQLKEILDSYDREILLVSADFSILEHATLARLARHFDNSIEGANVLKSLGAVVVGEVAHSVLLDAVIGDVRQLPPVGIRAKEPHRYAERHYASKWDEQRDHLKKRGRKKW